MSTLRIGTDAGVRSIVFARAESYNTIRPERRKERGSALDAAELDRERGRS